MARRYKGSNWKPERPRSLGLAGTARILRRDEPWLRVWMEQLTVTVDGLARGSGLSVERILLLARDEDRPTHEELEAIALGLETKVEWLIETQR